MMDTLKAKCPYCNNGCEHCGGTGTIKVRIAEGDWFTVSCLNKLECGFENGGHCCDGFPNRASEPCVICGGPTEWRHFSQLDEWCPFTVPGYEINRHRFHAASIERRRSALVDELNKVRELALRRMDATPLTVDEARLLHVCRICRGPFCAPFRTEFGKEFAHTTCLSESKV